MVLALYLWIGLFVMGVGLRVWLRFFYGARGPDKGDVLHLIIKIVSWLLLILALIPLLLVALFTWVGLIFVVFAAVILVEAIVQRRAAERRSMSKLLSLTIGRGGSIESLLTAVRGFHGIVGRAARRLVEDLIHGTPLYEAVRKNPRALPPEAIAFVAVGSTNAERAIALDELSRTDSGPLTAVWRLFTERMVYLTCVVLVTVFIITFMLIWIAPQFDNIFTDFGLDLPAATQLALMLAQFVGSYLAVPLSLFFLGATLASLGLAICYLVDVPVLRPVTDRLLPGRRTANVLRILAIAAEARQPLPPVFERLSNVYPSDAVRRRLARAAGAIKKGAAWCQALRDARLVSRAEQALLTTAEKVGNLPWALRELAERGDKRAMYRLAAAVQVIYPCAVILLAGFIGFFVIGMFLPLVSLIRSLS